MDCKELWSKIGTTAKSPRTTSANTLDQLAPLAVPFATRWDAEAERRRQLRTPEHLKALMDAQRAHNSARSQAKAARSQRSLARKTNRNPLSTARRSAAVAERAAGRSVGDAKGKLDAARREYPRPLAQVAAAAHVGHVIPAGFTSYALSTPQDWTMWPASVSAGLVALNVGALWLGRRKATTPAAEGATREERQLMERLAPTHWTEHADERGLAGTVTTPPELTPAGVVSSVRLDGRWTVKELRARTDSIRALLGMRSETRMEVGKGVQGDWARLLVRTRSASDGVSMTWTPDHKGIGVDEVTGEIVDVPLQPGVHLLIAGVTGMGKSVSWRSLFLRAISRPDWTPVLIDPKRQEAAAAQHVVRTIGQERDREERMAAIYAAVQELTQEMHRRQGLATGPAWTPDDRPENRNLIIVIDEGAAIVRMSRDRRYGDVLDLLEELWSEARAVGFQFVWATQNPTKTAGIPALVKDNMSAFLSLTTNAGEMERSIFGENAQQEGWTPSTLDGVPGRAMLRFRKRGSAPLRTWWVPDDLIPSLSSDTPWHLPNDEQALPWPALTLVKDDQAGGDYELAPPETVPAQASGTNRERVLAAICAGSATPKAVTEETGLNKGTVSREIKALVQVGAVLRAEDGELSAAAGEVSA